MRIAVSGSHGFIGSALMSYLRGQGHDVVPIVRQRAAPLEAAIAWNLEAQYVDREALSRTDAVIHLAGENIFGLWTKTKKEKIRKSRVEGTRLLCGALAGLVKPSIVISASAVGYYGPHAHHVVAEGAEAGHDFLASVCQEWEAAARVAERPGRRVVLLRNGSVLHTSGGALAKMLPAFRLGLGAGIGDGQQYFSWIALADLLAIVAFALQNEAVSGPINAVAPGAVTNAEFTNTLGEVLGKRVHFRVPSALLRLIPTAMAEELLLSSIRAKPGRLEALGFQFRYPDLRSALQFMLTEKER